MVLMVFRPSLILISIAISQIIYSAPTSATPPWKPKVSIPRAYSAGVFRPLLDKNVRARFYKLFRQGTQLIKAGCYQEADQVLDQAITLAPDHAKARLARSRVLLTIGYLTWNQDKIRLALDLIQHALTIDPLNREARHLAILIESLLKRMLATPKTQGQKSKGEDP